MDWTAVITAVATAIATLALAIFAGLTIRQNRNLIAATEKSAKAAEDSAKAAQDTVAEIQRDRELEYQPYIAWTLNESNPESEFVMVANYGRGSALHSLCCAAWTREGAHFLYTTLLFALQPGEKTRPNELAMMRRSGSIPDETMSDKPLGQVPTRVAFCRDHFGTFYRFIPFQPVSTWRQGHGNPPVWVRFYLNQFEELAKQQERWTG